MEESARHRRRHVRRLTLSYPLQQPARPKEALCIPHHHSSCSSRPGPLLDQRTDRRQPSLRPRRRLRIPIHPRARLLCPRRGPARQDRRRNAGCDGGRERQHSGRWRRGGYREARGHWCEGLLGCRLKALSRDILSIGGCSGLIMLILWRISRCARGKIWTGLTGYDLIDD